MILETPEGLELRTEIAGVGSRVAAGALDLILLLSGYLLLLLMLWGISSLASGQGFEAILQTSEFVWGLVLGGLFLIFPAYFIATHVFMDGSSPGKRMLHLCVVSSSGYPASTMQHTLRSLLWLVDAFVMIPVPLGILLMGASPRCRRIGDLAAGTLVIHEARRARRDELWPNESWTTRETKHLALTPGMAARLTEQDMRLLSDAIQRREMPRKLREQLYQDIVAHYSQRLGFTPAKNTRTSLKELFLFGREFRRA